MPRIIKDGLIYSEGAYQNYSTTEQVVSTWFDGSILTIPFNFTNVARCMLVVGMQQFVIPNLHHNGHI